MEGDDRETAAGIDARRCAGFECSPIAAKVAALLTAGQARPVHQLHPDHRHVRPVNVDLTA
jgi:hypothetical protein